MTTTVYIVCNTTEVRY